MEWKEVRLGDVCSISSSKRIFAKEYQTEGVPFYRGKEIIEKQRGNSISNELYISRVRFNEIKTKFGVPNKDDLLLTSVGTLGIPYVVGDEEFYFKDGNLTWFKDFTNLEVHFLYYWFLSPMGQAQIDAKAIGSTQKALTIDTLSKFSISLPSLSDQRRIASILSSLDRKIELNNKINAQLEEMAQAIFKNWFVDFEPFKDGKFVESELGMIPEGWRVGTLSEVADINPKRILKKGEEATYLDMKNMPTSGSFPHLWEKKVMNGGMKFKNGDTLMARITPCLENGKVAYVNFLNNNEVGFGSTEYIVMTSKNGVLPEVLYALCRYPDFVAYATSNMNGSSGRQRVSGEVIGNYQIVIPPTSVVEKLQPLFSSIMEQIKVHGFESLHLSQLRDTLLPRLMSGEIDLDEIEKTI